jgi:hypothetical protein
MHRFFFHIVDGTTVILDDEGALFKNREIAFAEAQASARDLAVQCIRNCQELAGRAILMTDEKAHYLLSVPLSHACGGV